jgi:hypothetical protein
MVNFSNPANYPLAVFICIWAVAAGVMMTWAVFHFFGTRDEVDPYSIPTDQAIYMREVRRRNHQDIAAAIGLRKISTAV